MKILAANRLSDGRAVWLAPDHSWSEEIDGAEIAHDAAGQEKLERTGQAAFLKNEVLDVELIDVQIVNGSVIPVRMRERIRAAGPSVRRDLGKQARADVLRAA
jgi:hypothetical protein